MKPEHSQPPVNIYSFSQNTLDLPRGDLILYISIVFVYYTTKHSGAKKKPHQRTNTKLIYKALTFFASLYSALIYIYSITTIVGIYRV